MPRRGLIRLAPRRGGSTRAGPSSSPKDIMFSNKPRSGKPRSGLWILVTTHGVNDFYLGAVAALLPYLVLEQHYDYAAVAGITLAATSLSSVAQPFFGFLSDRYSLRWLVLAGMAVAAVGIGVSGIVSSSYWWTWIAIAISGLGVAAYHPAATMAAREAGGGSSRSMSVFTVGGNIGTALAPTAVVITVGVFGLQATPLLVIPAILVSALYLLRVRRLRASASGATRLDAARQASTRATESILRNDWRLFAWLTVVLAFWSVAYVGTTSFIALYSIQRFSVSEATASIALSVLPAAGAVGGLGGGWLADRFGRLPVIRSAYALAAVCVLAIVLAPDAVFVAVATGALGCILFVPFAPQITLAHSYLPGRVALASGVTLGLTLSLGGLLNPLLGVLADHTTIQTVFAVLAGLLVVGFAATFILRERRDLVAEPGPNNPDEVFLDA